MSVCVCIEKGEIKMVKCAGEPNCNLQLSY